MKVTNESASMTGSVTLANSEADIFIPDKVGVAQAAQRTTHMAIGAHQDDIELLAFHGISRCFGSDTEWFTGVTVTDGSGSPRAGCYASVSDTEMAHIRRHEQRKAAAIGEYSMQVQLGYTSQAVKDGSEDLLQDLCYLLRQHTPRCLYLHSIFDFHGTHIAVVRAAIAAVKQLPPSLRPEQIVGVEVWGSLDWLPNNAKVVLSIDDKSHLITALLGVYDSQLSSGKRYDLGHQGRLLANATFHQPRDIDTVNGCQYAVNLMPLVVDAPPSPEEYIRYLLSRYEEETIDRHKTISY